MRAGRQELKHQQHLSKEEWMTNIRIHCLASGVGYIKMHYELYTVLISECGHIRSYPFVPFINVELKNYSRYWYTVALEIGNPLLLKKLKILSEEGAKSGQKYVLQHYFTKTTLSNSSDSDKIGKTIPSKIITSIWNTQTCKQFEIWKRLAFKARVVCFQETPQEKHQAYFTWKLELCFYLYVISPQVDLRASELKEFISQGSFQVRNRSLCL